MDYCKTPLQNQIEADYLQFYFDDSNMTTDLSKYRKSFILKTSDKLSDHEKVYTQKGRAINETIKSRTLIYF